MEELVGYMHIVANKWYRVLFEFAGAVKAIDCDYI